MKIEISLRELIQSDRAIELLNLNPYCIAEGADPDAKYYIEYDVAIELGLLK